MKKSAPPKAAIKKTVSKKSAPRTAHSKAHPGPTRNAVKQGKGVVSSSRQESKTVSKPQPTKAAAKTASRPAFSEPADVKQQTERFNKAMELFHSRELKKARDLFEQVAEGPNKEMAFSARMHLRMCEQRLEKQQVRLETAEDYYNYGVALTNQRRLDDARKHLETAIKMRDADHYRYALAVALALAGNLDEAAQHLSRAVEMQPINRVTLRTDPDFSEHIAHPAIQAILNPAKSA